MIAENGYEAFSLRQGAERIGYSPTTIYLYFADIAELLFSSTIERSSAIGRALESLPELLLADRAFVLENSSIRKEGTGPELQE